MSSTGATSAPAASVTHGAMSPMMRDAPLDTSMVTVLVVDDDKVVTQMLKRWLAEAGYSCLCATTAEEGWALLQDPNNSITLVITDANMPGEYDGFGLVDRIVKLREEQGISVIMMSGENDAVVKGVTLGSNDFMPKPIVKALLLRKVEMLVRHRMSKLELHKERLEKEVLRKEIAALSERMGTMPLVETPIQTITGVINGLLARSDVREDVRKELSRLKTIALDASNLYRPPMAGVMGNPAVDAVARSFLLNELAMTMPIVADENLLTFSSIAIDAPSFEGLTQWSFNVFERSEEELLVLAKQMFVHLDLLNHFDIKPDVLERFLVVVKQNYNANPYHNWRHAFDVTQASFCFLTQFQAHTKLTQLDLLGLLVASLCHDLGHPGVNNAYMVSTMSDLAVLYNDQSVLENFHAASLFQLLRQRPDLNIFASLPKAKFKEVRKIIIECIIATDPAVHYEYVAKLSGKVASDTPEWNRDMPDQRLLLMKSIIKMADISNVARVWEGPGYEWSQRVSQEFFAQGDREKAMGQEVAAFLDREATTICKNSMNFIDFVAAPLFQMLGKLNRDFDEQVVTLLTLNRRLWDTDAKKEAALAAANAPTPPQVQVQHAGLLSSEPK